jgi:hypothetical protein
MALSAAIAVGAVWLGLVASYQVDGMPPSFAITAVLTAAYISSAVRARFVVAT